MNFTLITIDWPQLTPWSAAVGGVMIGLAASLFILLHGRILGVSGIVAGLFRPKRGDLAWRLWFLAGVLSSPWLYQALFAPLTQTIDADWSVLVTAGLLVGLGTRYGAGCTSGHGVCGLSRLSLRSVVATLSFMAAGFVTVGLVRHAL